MEITQSTMEDKSNSYAKRASVLLFILTIAGTIGCCFWNQCPTKEGIRFILLAIVFQFIVTFYIFLSKKHIFEHQKNWWMIGCCNLLALLLYCNPYYINKYPYWVIGYVLLAYYMDVNLSLLMMYGAIIVSVITQMSSIDVLGVQLIMGTLLCITVKYLNKSKNLLFVLLFALSMNVTLVYILSNFDKKQLFNSNNSISFLAIIIVTVVTFLLSLVFKKPEAKCAAEQEEDNNFWDNLEMMQKEQIKKQELQEAVAPDAELLVQLKAESERLYEHCQHVAKVSRQAAIALGANEYLACAGGWYHEIGRLSGKDYVPLGVQLIKEHNLPEEIAEIIMQNNLKTDSPKSIEAAIVMLTDNILSTIQYLKSNNDTQITAEKVIENTFSVRMSKGTLNDADITLKDYNQLKEFYLSIVEELR